MVARVERGSFGRNVGINLINANVLYVDIGQEIVNDFILSLAHVALQLGQHRYGSDRGHLLKHILLPIFAHIVFTLGHVGAEVGSNDSTLAWVGYERENTCTEVVYRIVELLTLATSWG